MLLGSERQESAIRCQHDNDRREVLCVLSFYRTPHELFQELSKVKNNPETVFSNVNLMSINIVETYETQACDINRLV